MTKRVRNAPPHRCSCCGKVGHNIRQCKSPGALEIAKLRKAVAGLLQQNPRRAGKARLPVKTVQKSGAWKAEATKRYGTAGKNRSSEGDRAHVRQEASVCDGMQISAMDALSELIEVGFVRGHHTCPKCGGGLSEPKRRETDSRGGRSDGRLHVRCKTYKCNKRFNILDFSVFAGTRLNLPDVLRVLNHYTRSNVLKPPLVADCQRQLRLPRTCVEHIYNALLHKEMQAGRAHCAKKHALAGDVEVDAHCLRKLYVKSSNVFFARAVAEARERFLRRNPKKKVPSYWQAHLRIVGAKKRMAAKGYRGGVAVVRVLPWKLVPPGASPPVESTEEIQESKILSNVRSGSASQVRVYSDGAKSWERVCREQRLTNCHVKHNKHEWAKEQPGKKKGKCVVAGTQCIDRWWQSLDDWLPRSISNKKHGDVNPRIWRYLYAFIWRYHLPLQVDFRRALANAC